VWLKTLEVEDSTRDGYVGYIERSIRPALGAVPIAKLSTRSAGDLLCGAAPVPCPV
jgi:hypothetical protein